MQRPQVWVFGQSHRLYPKSPPIPSFTIPYISPLIQLTWKSEWKRVSEFRHWVYRKDCCFCIVCLWFNNPLKRAAPVVRLKDLSWTLSRELCINPKIQFTSNLYLHVLRCITPWTSASKIKKRMIQLRATSSGEMQEFIWRATSALWGFSSRCVHRLNTHFFKPLIRCIVEFNECTRAHPLWFRIPLKMAVPSNGCPLKCTIWGYRGDFRYSHSLAPS